MFLFYGRIDLKCSIMSIGIIYYVSLRILTSSLFHSLSTLSVLMQTWSSRTFPETQVTPRTSASGCDRAIINAWASSTPVSTSISNFFFVLL